MRVLVVLVLLAGVARADDRCPLPPQRNYHRLMEAHSQDFKLSAAMTKVSRDCKDSGDKSAACRTARARCDRQKAEFDAVGQAVHMNDVFESDITSSWLGQRFKRASGRGVIFNIDPNNKATTCSASGKRMWELSITRNNIGMNHWNLANEWLQWHAWATRVSKQCSAKKRQEQIAKEREAERRERQKKEREKKEKQAKAKREREKKLAEEKRKREDAERERREKAKQAKDKRIADKAKGDKAKGDKDEGETRKRGGRTRAPGAGPSVAAAEIRDCGYWDARLREARTCTARSRYHGRQTEGEATGPCVGRVKYFEDQRAACRNREEAEEVIANNGQYKYKGPALDFLAPLSDAASKVGELQQAQTQTNISMIKSAASQLQDAGYSGAQQIGDDPLATLGLEFADLSEVAKAQGTWNGLPLSWEAPPSQHDTVEQYCADAARVRARSCKQRCDHYWSERESTDEARACAADRFFAHFDDQLFRCEGWCDQRAMSFRAQCNSETKLVSVPGGGSRIEPCACHATVGLPPREVRSCPRDDFPK